MFLGDGFCCRRVLQLRYRDGSRRNWCGDGCLPIEIDGGVRGARVNDGYHGVCRLSCCQTGTINT